MLRRLLPRLCAAAAASEEVVDRAVEEYDVVIVGGGPSGLAAALRLKQLAKAANNEEFRVALIEKGSTLGQHTLSGACIEPRSLAELFPSGWQKEEGCPLTQKVSHDEFYLLTASGQYKSPYLPASLHNEHNYIGSLGAVCKWLGEKAEAEGVEIFCGFAGAQPVYSDAGKQHLEGVQLNDVGIDKNGKKTSNFQPGMILKGRQTILAEGSRGSLTKMLEKKFGLRGENNHQTFGLGIKEVWEVPKEQFVAGRITHTIGYPLSKSEGHANTYGGSFMYNYGENLMSVGFVVGLDYHNAYTRPYMEMQKWKTHPFVRQRFEGGKPLYYGARTLVEGGYAALPKLNFPGGVLIGDCAGFLNMPKIKGTHTAMKSGMLAAESIFEDLYKKGSEKPDYGKEATTYTDRFKSSWLHEELYAVRNVRQMFAFNFYAGCLYTGFNAMLLHGKEPWTLQHKHADHKCTLPLSQSKPITYPKPDGKLTFDLLTNHARSGATHTADQPSHLRLKKWDIATEVNLKVYGGPEGKYCPAGVYEFVEKDGKPTLVINKQNCVHCKACDIKDPTQNIDWTVPEGGGGPNYNAQL